MLAFRIVEFHIIKLQVTSCIQPVNEGCPTGGEKDAPVGGAHPTGESGENDVPVGGGCGQNLLILMISPTGARPHPFPTLTERFETPTERC